MRKQLIICLIAAMLIRGNVSVGMGSGFAQNALRAKKQTLTSALLKGSKSNAAGAAGAVLVEAAHDMGGVFHEHFDDEQDDEPVGGDPCHPKPKNYKKLVHEFEERMQKRQTALEDNEEELDTLQQARCSANFLFIQTLKEHRVAVDIVAKLIDMVSGYNFKNLLQMKDREQFANALIAISLSTDKKSAQIVKKIFSQIEMIQLGKGKPDDVFKLMHATSQHAKTLKKLTFDIKKGPNSLAKILAHLSIDDKIGEGSAFKASTVTKTVNKKSSPKCTGIACYKFLLQTKSDSSSATSTSSGLQTESQAAGQAGRSRSYKFNFRNIARRKVNSEGYKGLDQNQFKNDDPLKLQNQKFKKIDYRKLKGNLDGLLTILKEHLIQSMDDCIEREIDASLAFAEWRYEMEQENFEMEARIEVFEKKLKALKKEAVTGPTLPAHCD